MIRMIFLFINRFYIYKKSNRIYKYDQKNNVFIVAEAGNNHEGDFSVAKKLIDKASESGADAIKFQTYDVDNFIDPKLQKSYKKFKKFSLSYEQFYKLSKYCKKKK